MSSSTSNLDLLTQSQSGHYVTANGLFDAASPAMLFGRRQALCSGLNWFYYGGVLLADGVTTLVANNAAALVLTASATNYIEATTAGVVSKNTVGFTAGSIPLYTVVTGVSSVTSYTDQRPLTYQSAAFTATIKTFLATPSSANLKAAVTDETGSGALVFATSPTLTTPVINTVASVGGAWTAAATWTLPALTLGGTVSGGGQQLNNVIIGTVTPLAGAFTTLAASGQVTLSNASDYNIYASGAGSNYMAGSLGIGSTSLSGIKFRSLKAVSDSAVTSYVGYFDGTHTLTANNSFRHIGFASAPVVAQGAFNATASFGSGGSVQGVFSAPSVSGASGTVTCAAGVVADVRNTGAGTLTNAVGFLSAAYANSGGGTLTNVYGFHAADTSAATNNYGFFGNLAAGAGKYNCYMDGTAANYFAGDMQFDKTVTAAGTTGNRTISKNSGSVNFAAAATSLVVTNTLVTVNSIIVATVAANDATMKSVQAVAAAGSFTLYANAAATAETRVNFIVIN